MKPLAAAPLDLTDPESHADEAPVLYEAASCEEEAHVACCLTPPLASWQKCRTNRLLAASLLCNSLATSC